MKIKVCGITRLEQLQSLESLSVDYAGLIFYDRSPRFVGKHGLTAKMVGDARLNIKRVGVFVNESEVNVLRAVDQWGLTMVQLHGEESPVFCERISNHVNTIKAFRVNQMEPLSYKINAYEDAVEYFLFDALGQQYGGTGKQFDWNLLINSGIKKPFFLSGGIGPDDALSIANFQSKNEKCFAVDVNSRFEIEPGVKDLELVKKFVDSISKI